MRPGLWHLRGLAFGILDGSFHGLGDLKRKILRNAHQLPVATSQLTELKTQPIREFILRRGATLGVQHSAVLRSDRFFFSSERFRHQKFKEGALSRVERAPQPGISVELKGIYLVNHSRREITEVMGDTECVAPPWRHS